MKTLVLFYSYTGHTKKIAEELAKREDADIQEIVGLTRPGKVKVYLSGALAAKRCQAWEIQPLGVDLGDYDRLFLLAPVWAGFPAPYLNAVLNQLSSGKTVYLKLISASGKSGCKEQVEAMIKNKGSILGGYEDIKA